jgi:hypothetical protein
MSVSGICGHPVWVSGLWALPESPQKYPQSTRLQGHALGRPDTLKGANPLFYLMF